MSKMKLSNLGNVESKSGFIFIFVNMIRTIVLFFLFGITACKISDDKTLFTMLSSNDTNIDFSNILADSEDFNVLKYGYFYNGGGVAAADFNNDGWIDLYFTANVGANKLFIHAGGKEISYKDVSSSAGVQALEGWKTGVSIVDINNDGWLDIYVCRSAANNYSLRKNLLYINNKNLTFTESASKYGLDDAGYTTQAAFFDYDKDGDLDCFLLNHSIQEYAGYSNNLSARKKESNAYYASKLLQNNAGIFIDKSNEAGIIGNVLSFGLGLSISDFNGDGWQDIYVANDYNEEDYLYINNKNGKFVNTIKASTYHTSLFSMGCDAADINNDGLIDLLSLDMLPESNERIKMTTGDDNYEKYNNLIKSGFHAQYMRNMLQLNLGSKNTVPLFNEVGQYAGLSNTDWSWSALIADYDLDGLKDVFITNGYEKDYTNMDFLNYAVDVQSKFKDGKNINQLEVINHMPSIKEHNYLYKNNGNASFINYSEEAGFTKKNVSAGAVYADLDNDGDLDLIVNNVNEKASIYKNNIDHVNQKHLSIKLKDKNSVQGTKVYVYNSNNVQLYEYSTIRGFQSSVIDNTILGLGKNKNADSIVVVWPDLTKQKLLNVKSNQVVTITKNDLSSEIKLSNGVTKYYNVDTLKWKHAQTNSNDFKTQYLLPFAQSFHGPKITNSNGKNTELMYVCGGLQQEGILYKIENNKVISKTIKRNSKSNLSEGDAIFFDIDGDKDEDLMVCYFGYNETTYQKPLIFVNNKNEFIETSNQQFFLFNNQFEVFSQAIANIDVDNDGDQDVFIGNRGVPKAYPSSAESIVLINNGKGQFTKIVKKDIGNITDALVEDINGDGLKDLVVAREFGVISYFPLGKMFDFTNEISISNNGYWMSIAASDIDKNGKIDIVGGNIGLNNQLVYGAKSIHLYYDKYFGSSNVLPIIAKEENGKMYPFAAKDELLSQIPILKKKYTNYKDFSNVTIPDLFNKDIGKKMVIENFQSCIFYNNDGKSFESKPLPYQAQLAPIYAIEISDVDKDNVEEIILGGNVSQSRVRIGNMRGSHIEVFKIKNKEVSYSFNIGVKGDVRSINKIGTSFFVGRNGDNLLSFK